MMVQSRQRTKTPVVINFQESAPASMAVPGLFQDMGPETVAVPGLLRGLWEAHQRFGSTKWADLFQAAVRLSENGFPVSFQLAEALANLPEDSPLKRTPLFFPRGYPLAEGQILVQPQLAALLKSVALNGVQGRFHQTKPMPRPTNSDLWKLVQNSTAAPSARGSSS